MKWFFYFFPFSALLVFLQLMPAPIKVTGVSYKGKKVLFLHDQHQAAVDRQGNIVPPGAEGAIPIAWLDLTQKKSLWQELIQFGSQEPCSVLVELRESQVSNYAKKIKKSSFFDKILYRCAQSKPLNNLSFSSFDIRSDEEMMPVACMYEVAFFIQQLAQFQCNKKAKESLLAFKKQLAQGYFEVPSFACNKGFIDLAPEFSRLGKTTIGSIFGRCCFLIEQLGDKLEQSELNFLRISLMSQLKKLHSSLVSIGIPALDCSNLTEHMLARLIPSSVLNEPDGRLVEFFKNNRSLIDAWMEDLKLVADNFFDLTSMVAELNMLKAILVDKPKRFCVVAGSDHCDRVVGWLRLLGASIKQEPTYLNLKEPIRKKIKRVLS